jgi:hypothetical protein
MDSLNECPREKCRTRRIDLLKNENEKAGVSTDSHQSSGTTARQADLHRSADMLFLSVFETRSAPASLVATHPDFTFYVVHPIHSIHRCSSVATELF